MTLMIKLLKKAKKKTAICPQFNEIPRQYR